MSKVAKLAELNASLAKCQLCRLYQNRINVVPGTGNPDAHVMFVGEAPGRDENEQGLPFVGAAGQFLNQLLESVNWNRDEVFITNIVKDQPVKNRDPLPDEIQACTSNWLEQQIKIINPSVIVPLGRHAMYYFLPNVGSISKLHGKAFKRANGRVYFPLYHPAVSIYRQEMRPILIADFHRLSKLVKQITEERKING